jgi:hypothetical protein
MPRCDGRNCSSSRRQHEIAEISVLRVPNVDEPESLADWMEASLLVQDDPGKISDSDLQEALVGAGWDREEGLEHILQQFRHRSNAVGARYPVERVGSGFRARGEWGDYPCYSFLLFVSLNQSYGELNFRRGAREPAILFELITARALELFLGGAAIRIGSPRLRPVPAGFPAALAYLAGAIREPVRNDGGLERHGAGDDGLDIWLTKGFQDERTSSVFVVAQCAIGEDWGVKRSELDLDLWYRHIDWFTRPLKAFAVPFQINQDSWRETAARGGLILDRLRIAQALEPGHLPGPIVARIRNWTRQRIERTIREVSA